VKVAHFRLKSASQKRACLSSLNLLFLDQAIFKKGDFDYLTHFPTVKKKASLFPRCGEDDNYPYLSEAPWIGCKGHVYTTLQVLVWLAMVLYMTEVPFRVFLPLLRRNIVATRDKLPPQVQEALDILRGSLYLPYKKEFRSCFEILLLVRRMLVAFSLSLITSASSF